VDEANAVEHLTPERWEQIKDLFQAALQLDPDEHDAFLEHACSGDEALRARVKALLLSDERQWQLIEKPAFEAAAGLLTDDQPTFAGGEVLGHYRILRLIGRGGMGEVYLAEDAKLGRKIALKLLPVDFTTDELRMLRFQREARAASALNHPNIITIHEISDFEGKHFIATEFVNGETLRQRLINTKLTLSEALEIAVQVASALSAAHQAGIVHRDIKPENLMIRPDGYVKVLDFGLAKHTEQSETTSHAHLESKPDISSGVVMGTVRYMSPEQAQGDIVDARSDIFSCGVVLYEMLVGRPPFIGESTAELVAAILTNEPSPISELSQGNPEELDHIIRRALEKSQEERYARIEDLLLDLRNLQKDLELESGADSLRATRDKRREKTEVQRQQRRAAAEVSGDPEPHAPISRPKYLATAIISHKGWVAALSLLFIAAIGAGYFRYRTSSEEIVTTRTLELAAMTTSGTVGSAAVSPDGKYLAFANDSGLWTRELTTGVQLEILRDQPGSFWGLAFSPDGNQIYYFANPSDGRDAALFRIAARGGVPSMLVSNISNTNGPDRITFSPDGTRLAFVSESAGESTLIVTNADGTNEEKIATGRPSYLGSAAWSPNGRSIVCTRGSGGNGTNRTQLVEVSVEDKTLTSFTTRRWIYIADIAWSGDGNSLLITAVDRPGEPGQVWKIAYPSGIAHRVTADLNSYTGLSLTADSSVLISVRGQTAMNIWTQSAQDITQTRQITSGPAARDGMAGVGWTPDGRIVYSSNASGRYDIWVMNADGGDRKQVTHDLGTDRIGLSVSPDGRSVVFVSNRSGKYNVWIADINGTSAKQLTNGNGDLNPVFSADGRWVIYNSSDTGSPVPRMVPIEGGTPAEVPYLNTSAGPNSRSLPGASPDGRLTAFSMPPDETKKVPRIGVGSIEGVAPIRTIRLPAGATLLQRMRWTPDSLGLTFINRNRVWNIWTQPLDGSPPRQVTDFKADSIFNFAWSCDGKQLAIVRSVSSSDAVMMRNF
jgi:serine/threonine protein kinase/Tol biopolymer transport system component